MAEPVKVGINDGEYPPLLREYPINPPHVLYRVGAPIPSTPIIGIAGTREPTEYGREVAYKLGRELARNGFAIATGFAAGIDTEAVKGAVSVGGRVIAVLPYLYEDVEMSRLINNPLLHELLGYSGLTAISENPVRDGAMVRQWLVLRNRIIDGMSVAVIIPETRYKSRGWGTYHHIRFGLGVGKPVYIFKPFTKEWDVWEGYMEFARRGAGIIQSIDDAIRLLTQITR